MAKLPQHCLERLDARGLDVYQFPEEHKGYPGGARISKPEEVPGNSMRSYTQVELGPEYEATLMVYFIGDGWLVETETQTDAPWYSANTWETPEQAIDDVLEFFFGDPARIAAMAQPYENKRLADCDRTIESA